MKNATGISRWTNPNRSHAIHIMKGNVLLCGKTYFTYSSFDFDLSQVTCKVCLNKYKKLQIY